MNAILVLLAAVVAGLVGLHRRGPSSPAGLPAWSGPARGRPPAAPPKRFAYVYQLPSEIAVRMAIGTSPRDAREMGIFGSAAMAAKVAAEQGATLAWQGVRELP